jgi:hypothetical protein
MNALVETEKLAALVTRAATKLATATTAAEVLDTIVDAQTSYDVAKAAARLAKAKGAHDDVLATVYRAQADMLVIEAEAKCKLADEYDAAQARGEVAKHGEIGRGRSSQREHLSTSDDIGLTRKLVHEARQVRDAERKQPGIVRRTVEAKLAAGEPPLRADVRRAVTPAPPPMPPQGAPVQAAPCRPPQRAATLPTVRLPFDAPTLEYLYDLLAQHLDDLLDNGSDDFPSEAVEAEAMRLSYLKGTIRAGLEYLGVD